jgi:hypothetical protein
MCDGEVSDSEGIKWGNWPMSLRAILSAAAVAAALFPTPGQAEVLHLSYDYAIDGLATGSGAPVMGGFNDLDVFSEPHGGGFEVQSAPIVSPDTVGLDGGTLHVTVVTQPSTWTTTLLGFAGLGL